MLASDVYLLTFLYNLSIIYILKNFWSKKLKGEDKSTKRNNDLFKLPDLILYTAVIVVILALFLIPLLTNSNKNLSGFDLYKNGEIILSVDFNKKEVCFIDEAQKDLIDVTIEKEFLKATVYQAEDKKDYNVISANLQEKWVQITESTCSNKKDCVHFSPLKSESGVIVCQPHNLKITPRGNNYIPVVTG